MTTRRMLIAAIPVLVVAACATKPSTAPSQLATDVNLIATGLQSEVTALQGVPGIPAATLVTVQGYLTKIEADAALVASSVVNAPTSTVVDIANLVARIAEAVLPTVPGGSTIAAVVIAAQALVPVILAAVGAPVPLGAAPAMTPDDARARLAQASA